MRKCTTTFSKFLNIPPEVFLESDWWVVFPTVGSEMLVQCSSIWIIPTRYPQIGDLVTRRGLLDKWNYAVFRVNRLYFYIEMFSGVVYALLAGFLGAVASSSAKLSLGADYLKGVCETGLKTWAGEDRTFQQDNDSAPCDWVNYDLYCYQCIEAISSTNLKNWQNIW